MAPTLGPWPSKGARYMKFCNLLCSAFGFLATIFGAPTLANGETLSLSYRGEGIHASLPSQGAVLTYRPVSKFGISYSFNYALVDQRSAIEESRAHDINRAGSSEGAIPLQDAMIERKLHELQVRWYPMGGSFFLAMSGMSGPYRGRYAEAGDTSDVTNAVNYRGTTSYGSFSLGNIWVRRNIVIGFEWASVAHNIRRTEKMTGGTSMVSAERKLFQEQLRHYTEATGLMLGVFHFGIGF